MSDVLTRLSEMGRLWRRDRHGAGIPEASAHEFLDHLSVFAFCPPEYRYPFAEAGKRPVFDTPGKDAAVEETLETTRLFLLFGAAHSSAFETVYRRGDAAVLVFEPDPERLERFAAELDPEEVRNRPLFLFCGDPDSFTYDLDEIFSAGLFRYGYPAFLCPAGTSEDLAKRFHDLVEYVEFLYYRFAVHPLDGHDLRRSRPLRDLTKGLFYYDQIKHIFENLPEYALRPDIAVLKDRFIGRTAILVGAGPDLDAKLDYIARQAGHAVVIAVNNAMKTLAAHGIEPHFCLVIDPAELILHSYAGLPRFPRTWLVSHQLCHLPRDIFQRIAFFGDCLRDFLPAGTNLPWHGSVLTTAFSLARHLGCDCVVLTGAQLSSPHPWQLAYSRHSIHAAKAAPNLPLTNRHPQLYPVTLPTGATVYTTLNFRDVSLWLLREIARSKLRVIQTSSESLLQGQGVLLDEDFAASQGPSPWATLDEIPATRRPANIQSIAAFAREQTSNWRQIRRTVRDLLAQDLPMGPATELFQTFEANTVSYLVQRFSKFDNARFHKLYFRSTSLDEQREALRNYFLNVAAMADAFMAALTASLKRIQEM